MTEAEKKQTNTRSYRVDDETAEKIASLAKELGVNQNGVFEVLLSAYELQQDAVIVPEAKKDIEAFVSHLRSIQDAYHNLVSINLQTEEKVRQEFQRRLDNNEKQIADLIETKEQQKARLEELQDAYKKAEGDLVLKESELAEAKQKVTEREKSLDDKQTIIDSLTARLPEQAEIDAKMKSLEQEIQGLRSSLSSSEEARLEAKASVESARAELDMAKMQAAAAEKAHQQEIGTLTKQAAAELKAAVSDARQEERDKAQVKLDKLQDKIEEYREQLDKQQGKLEEYRIQLEQYKAQADQVK